MPNVPELIPRTSGGNTEPDSKGNVQVGVSNSQAAANQSDNTFVGDKAGATSTGGKNAAVGHEAFDGKGAGTPDECNVAVGFQAGLAWKGEYLTAVGALAGYKANNETTTEKTFLGYEAGYEYAEGKFTATGVGAKALYKANVKHSVAVGDKAAQEALGEELAAFGTEAAANSNTSEGTFFGTGAGQSAAGAGHTAIGAHACGTCEGAGILAIGDAAGSVATGTKPIWIGAEAGRKSSASTCVGIGVKAGKEASGEKSVYIGFETGVSCTAKFATLLGTGAASSADSVVVLGKGFADVANPLLGVVIGTAATAALLGKGEGVVAINNCKTKPTENHPSGGQLYVESGKLFFRGGAGKVTEIAGA